MFRIRDYRFIIAVIPFIVILFLHVPRCSAQNIAASEDVDREYLRLNADMTTYQIIMKDQHEEYMSYYGAIREKILAKLKRNYKRYYNDGDVHLFFVIDKKGALVRMDIALSKSTKDMKLIDIALLSLQQAEPFGPFPEELKDSGNIPFSLVITFKKNS